MCAPPFCRLSGHAGPYTEYAAAGEPAPAPFGGVVLGHGTAYTEEHAAYGPSGRRTRREEMLKAPHPAALERLNPNAPLEAINQAIEQITKDRGALHYARANGEVHDLLRDRVPVSIGRPDGSRDAERLAVIDWDDPTRNDFLLVSQLWIK